MLYSQKEDKKCWENNISEWTGLKLSNALRKSKNSVKWRQNVASVVPHRSMRSDISRASSFFFFKKSLHYHDYHELLVRAKFPRSICICFSHGSNIGWQCGYAL